MTATPAPRIRRPGRDFRWRAAAMWRWCSTSPMRPGRWQGARHRPHGQPRCPRHLRRQCPLRGSYGAVNGIERRAVCWNGRTPRPRVMVSGIFAERQPEQVTRHLRGRARDRRHSMRRDIIPAGAFGSGEPRQRDSHHRGAGRRNGRPPARLDEPRGHRRPRHHAGSGGEGYDWQGDVLDTDAPISSNSTTARLSPCRSTWKSTICPTPCGSAAPPRSSWRCSTPSSPTP